MEEIMKRGLLKRALHHARAFFGSKRQWGIRLLGLYCILVVSLLIYLMTAFMPVPETNAPGEIVLKAASLFGRTLPQLPLEIQLVVMVAIVGALGGAIYMAYSFARHVGTDDFDAHWTWWTVIRPFSGGAMGTFFYVIVRGLMLPRVTSLDQINVFGLLSFSGLAGMFSKQAVIWLSKTFDQMLGRLHGGTKTDNVDHRKDPPQGTGA
ncbi:hypothetical protein ACFLSZ_02300 [Candidatus Bipolaricaulota bacterium]